ncbi:acyl-CoA thioesterase [Streptomyces sp. NBC_01451]|uniref:acyl-CoA thioesterase n=1 Tax=Streptomyces sp. NBC_01451 TaxID=2903872 RepID=UPI002E333EC5|nr:acyl-CoA thioesterase domain-containing protein [Streptomyces sp. NBC_01451]
MTDLWSDLLACLDLRPIDGDSQFEGTNQHLGHHRLFGGQLLGQFVRAAELACPDKAVKSVHALFPRAGRPDEPVLYEVTRHHQGSAFATLGIVARQSPGVMATASVSMHAVEDGPEHQTPFHVPAVPGEKHAVHLDLLPWDTRAATALDTPGSEAPEYELWMRTPAVGPGPAPALMAYATDLSLIGTALRQVEGVGQHDANTAFTSAVTAHTVRFHRPFRTDTWLLLRQHSPLLAHGRCYGLGDVLTEEGSLVASYAQEALLRFK